MANWTLAVVSGPDCGYSYNLTPGKILIGRSKNAQVSLEDRDLSRVHAELHITAQGVHIRDLKSTNGTWLNGKRICENTPLSEDSILWCGRSGFLLKSSQDPQALVDILPAGTLHLRRTPRLFFPPHEKVPHCPQAPQPPSRQPMSWLTMAMPFTAAGIMYLSDVGSQNRVFLLLIILTPIGILVGNLVERLYSAWRYRRTVRTHRTHLRRFDDLCSLALRQESVKRRNESPDLARLGLAVTPTTLLWSRQPSHEDFLQLRLGLGRVHSADTIIHPASANQTNLLMCADAPITFLLRDSMVGIFGHYRYGVTRSLLVQIATLHSPQDVRIIISTTEDKLALWQEFTRIPHYGITGFDHVALSTEDLTELMRCIEKTGRHPHHVLVIDDSGTSMSRNEIPQALLGTPNISVIQLTERFHQLSEQCQVTITAEETGSYHRTRDEPVTFTPELVTSHWTHQLIASISPYREAVAIHDEALPPKVCLLDLHSNPTMIEIARRWREKRQCVAFTLGMGNDGVVEIDLAIDGPHLLLAGTTGAGKSECLISLLVSAALTHSPEHLAFLLIDYKGGATFSRCANLPHTAGFISDLDEGQATRLLISLRAEVHRRERAFAEAAAPNIDAYSAGENGRPLPRLLIVIDEFAFLAAELPTFMDSLIDIARRGRSLGLHLVLATQRPTGIVSAEIKANMSARICLRVTEPSESNDVIGALEASEIDARIPGRAYVRFASGLRPCQIGHVNREELEEVIRRIAKVAAGAKTVLPEKVFANPLPERLSLDEITRIATCNRTYDETSCAPEIAFGLVDEPHKQRLNALSMSLKSGNNLAIVGHSGSGRTTALRALIVGVHENGASHRIDTAIIDCGGDLKHLAYSPQCQVYSSDVDPDHVIHILTALISRVSRNKRALAASWNNNEVPYTLVLVDSWETLTANCGEEANDLLNVLLREGSAGRVHVAMTGNRGLTVSPLWRLVNQRILLPLPDSDVLLSAGVSRERIQQFTTKHEPGHGLLLGHPICDIRTADVKPASEIAGSTNSHVSTGLPPRVRWETRYERSPQPEHIPLGLTYGSLGHKHEVASLDSASEGPGILIAGRARTGRSTALVALARWHTNHNRPFIAIASPRSPLWKVSKAELFQPHEIDTLYKKLREIPKATILVDDCESILDTAADALLTEALTQDRLVIAAGRTEELVGIYRGFVKMARRSNTGVVLSPRRADGELFSTSIRPTHVQLPGRGLFVRSGRAFPIQLFC